MIRRVRVSDGRPRRRQALRKHVIKGGVREAVSPWMGYVPQPPERQRIGNQIDAAFVFAKGELRMRASLADANGEVD